MARPINVQKIQKEYAILKARRDKKKKELKLLELRIKKITGGRL